MLDGLAASWRAHGRRNGKHTRRGWREQGYRGIGEIVRCSIEAGLAAHLVVIAEGGQKPLVLLPTLLRLKRQERVGVKEMLQIEIGLLDEKTWPNVAILIELGRGSVSGERADSDLDVSERRVHLLSAKRRRQQDQRQKQS